MKVLITGGSGFIGTHLSEVLIEAGHKVRVIDRRFPKDNRVEFIEGDIRWLGDCDKAVKGVDAIFHLGARISVDESLDLVWHYYNENLLTTINIFTSALRFGVIRILHISSCEVYGNNSFANESSPCEPTSAYASSKYAAERAALAYKNQHPELKITILRCFNCFGEYQKPFQAGAMIPTFILQALNNKEITIHGKGNQQRDYLYVKDTALAQLSALESEIEGVYNISSGQGKSVNDIAQKIVSKIGAGRISYVEDPRKNSQMNISVGDSSKFQRETNWKPVFAFDDGLDRTIKFFKN